jgi:hypothetical protein
MNMAPLWMPHDYTRGPSDALQLLVRLRRQFDTNAISWPHPSSDLHYAHDPGLADDATLSTAVEHGPHHTRLEVVELLTAIAEPHDVDYRWLPYILPDWWQP